MKNSRKSIQLRIRALLAGALLALSATAAHAQNTTTGANALIHIQTGANNTADGANALHREP